MGLPTGGAAEECDGSHMLEDEVLEKAIGNFKKQGWVCIYRTWPTRSSGSTTNLAGVDAIMSKMNNAKFIFIEALKP